MTCNRDCFNCPYDDCIVDDDTDSEIAESLLRDFEINQSENGIGVLLRGRGRPRHSHEDIARRKREYYKRNRELYIERSKDRYREVINRCELGEKICTRCAKPMDADYQLKLCPTCREKRREYQKERYRAKMMMRIAE